MKYISTRGQSDEVSFSEAVLAGLARDGGLYIPEFFPNVQDQLDAWKGHSFQELAFNIFSLYVGTDISHDELREIIKTSYDVFESQEVAPVSFNQDFALLELYHGPTLALKDVALQFLGNLFELLLKKQNRKLNILGATS